MATQAIAKTERTLADIRRELFEGTEELFNQFHLSITEQMELTPEQQETLNDYLATTVEKRDKMANFIKWLEGQAELIRKREVELAARRHDFERVAGMFRSTILLLMENWKGSDGACKAIKRVDGLESSFRVVKNPGRVEITDETALPGQYITYKPQPDKTLIKEALEGGIEIPGARMSDTTYRLDIR